MYQKLYMKASEEANRRLDDEDLIPIPKAQLDSRIDPMTGGLMSRRKKEVEAAASKENSILNTFINLRKSNKETVSQYNNTQPMNGMEAAAMAAFGRLEEAAGPLKVNSAFRSEEHNRKVGGAKKSQHVHGKAFDVSTVDMSQADKIKLIGQAQAAGFRGIGIYANAMHFDIGPKRSWGPTYKNTSVPKWARPYL